RAASPASPIRTRTRCPMRSGVRPGSTRTMHSRVRTSLRMAGSCRTERRWVNQLDSRTTRPRPTSTSRASSWMRTACPARTRTAERLTGAGQAVARRLDSGLRGGEVGPVLLGQLAGLGQARLGGLQLAVSLPHCEPGLRVILAQQDGPRLDRLALAHGNLD